MAHHPSFVPRFQVDIDGTPAPAALAAHIISITYVDGMEGADRVEIAIANPNLRWLDDPLLQIDNGLELHLGYAGQPLERVFVGEITGVNATFPNGGMPTITIAAHDFLNRLTSGTKDRAFFLDIPTFGHFPLPDPIVAGIVTGTNLLIPDIDPTGAALSFLTFAISYVVNPNEFQRSIRFQQGTSDFDFLRTIARDNGWEMYIDHTAEPQGYRLRFSFLIQDYSPSVVLKYGASLMNFTPRLTTVGQVLSVATRVWISAIQLELVLVLSWDYDRAAFDLMLYPGIGSLETMVGDSKSTLKIDALGPATAPRQILSELLPRLNNRLTGSGSSIGDLRLKAGRVVELQGLGEQFSGLYRITTATHVIDNGGYRTDFDARKEIWFGSIPTPKGASGLLRVQGQTIR